MATFRASISFPTDSALPRDEQVITPHFIGDDSQGLAAALKANLIANTATTTKPFKIKVYDAEKAPPSYPVAQAEQVGGLVNNGAPREVSLCLSYYAGYNRPRYRGRLYLPFFLLSGTTDVRPSLPQQQAALDFSNVFTAGLPSGTQWVVWSRTDRKAYVISHAWVDNEWDIQRSRGMRGTSRVEKSI